MKKIKFLSILISAALFCSACKTTQQAEPADAGEPQAEVSVEESPAAPEPVTTYINTGVSKSDGEIYTVCVFKKITGVTAINTRTRERFEIPAENYSYDGQTTRLNLTLPEGIHYARQSLAYHIVGEAEDPGVFVLKGFAKKVTAPAVFIKGKKAIEGKDYSFNAAQGRITCLKPLNVDKDSYQIHYAIDNGFATFSNKTEEYAAEYKKLTEEWQKENSSSSR